MQDIITVRGFVATDPAVRRTSNGTEVAGFRLATTERRFDRDAGTWVDAHTNWYSVSAFGQLGSNTAQSVRKGNPVIITGRLRVREWAAGERSGTSVDVVADAVGLDLGYGSTAFVRNHRVSGQRPAEESGGDGTDARDAAPGHADTEEDGHGPATASGFSPDLHDAFAPRRDDAEDLEDDSDEREDSEVAVLTPA